MSRTTPVITPPRAIVIARFVTGLAVFHDDGRARTVRPRRAVAGSEIGVLERLQLVLAGWQAVKGECAAVVGGRGLTWRRARDVRERHAHAARRLLRLAGRRRPCRRSTRCRPRARALSRTGGCAAAAAPHAIARTRTMRERPIIGWPSREDRASSAHRPRRRSASSPGPRAPRAWPDPSSRRCRRPRARSRSSRRAAGG